MRNELRLGLGLLLAALVLAPAGGAEAHTGARAFVLLLPTDRYMAGGAAIVALSFVVMALVPAAGLEAVGHLRWRLGRLPGGETPVPSLISLALALVLISAGFTGTRDPLENPLPPVVWTVWWVGLTFLHALFGDLWAHLNPWRGAYRALTALAGLRTWRAQPPLRYPRWLGHWPALAIFFAFTWFELVYPAPQDPARLAGVVAAYLGATLIGMLVFGETAWLGRAEAFSVFFRIVASLSPFAVVPEVEHKPARGGALLVATLPGMRLLEAGAFPPGKLAFVLLALASVSFDGLSRTFWWLGLVGANPLEHPGRIALMAVNTLGLFALFCALVAVYMAAVLLGRRLAGGTAGGGESVRRFVVSIVPIAFGYHFAHYLPTFLVDVQYALSAISDPFALGWNLFGTAEHEVTASFLTDQRSVEIIWNLQAAGIVAAHVAAVAIAHFLALATAPGPRRAVLGQLPMTALMIAYTLFGLWLLATPAVG